MNEMFNEFVRLMEDSYGRGTRNAENDLISYKSLFYLAKQAQSNVEEKQLERMNNAPIPIYGHCGFYESDNATAMLCKHCGKSKYFHGSV